MLRIRVYRVLAVQIMEAPKSFSGQTVVRGQMDFQNEEGLPFVFLLPIFEGQEDETQIKVANLVHHDDAYTCILFSRKLWVIVEHAELGCARKLV